MIRRIDQRTNSRVDLYAHAQREDDEKAAEIMGAIMTEQVEPAGQVVNL
ncbi:MAG: hypothetical protein LBK67_08860 [Coriobacteriales bacterium]|jgi:hypothetical protein|nr:hypothetical protein [Coriobacteriales bacterium]